MTIPAAIPRKLNPVNTSPNPWCPKIMGNACKERYRMPLIRAVLERNFSEAPRKPRAEGYLPDIQKQDHPVVQQHLYAVVRERARTAQQGIS